MPRPQTGQLGRRSGRLDQPASGGPFEIVKGLPTATKYRVQNTGKHDIDLIEQPVGIDTLDLTVSAGSSVDFELPASKRLEASGSSGKLKCVYDRIDLVGAVVRPGRFDSESAAVTIINSLTGLYRFYNTRRGASRVVVDGTNHNIRRGCTLDHYISGVEVEARGRGVYDHIAADTVSRSGHFRTDATIDVAVLMSAATYRFFNADEEEFDVKVSGGAVIATVKGYSSVDVMLPAGTIEIEPSSGLQVQGAYDFLQ